MGVIGVGAAFAAAGTEAGGTTGGLAFTAGAAEAGTGAGAEAASATGLACRKGETGAEAGALAAP